MYTYIASYSIACGRMKGMPTRCCMHVWMEACIAAHVCVRAYGFAHACAFFLQSRSHVSHALSGSRKQRDIPITHGRRPYAMHIAKSLAVSMHVYVDILMDPYVYASLALLLSTRPACAASVPGRWPSDTLPCLQFNCSASTEAFAAVGRRQRLRRRRRPSQRTLRRCLG